jgi:sulfite exporter TauE/SafE/copper chaperone CopZ
MHCPSCELLLEKKLKKMDGVKDADASLNNHQVTVTYTMKRDKKDTEELNKQFAELGYTLHEELEESAEGSKLNKFLFSLVIASFVMFGFFIFIESEVFKQFSLTESSSLPAFFVLGLVAGISSCAALVGGLLMSLSKQWIDLYGGKDKDKQAMPFILFNAGRLVSFAVLGVVLGFIGSFFQISLTFTAIITLLVAGMMILLGLQMMGISYFNKFQLRVPKQFSSYISNEQNFQGKYMPFATGALTFFIPCGFTLLAQTIALSTGNPITAGAMMFLFALGTLPTLAVLSFTSLTFQKNYALAGSFNLVVGILVIFFGLYTFNSQLNVLGLPSVNDAMNAVATEEPTNEPQNTALGATIVEESGEQYQQLTMEARGFEYYPKSVELEAGIPTKLTVNNYDVLGCAKAMALTGMYDDVVFLEGPTSTAEFTPEPGSYKITCTMGMVDPVTVTVK